MSVRQYKLSSLRREFKDTDFLDLYQRLIRHSLISDDDKTYLLTLALIFLSYDDKDVRRFGYGILLKFGNLTEDYRPLYEVALAQNYIPVVKLIENNTSIGGGDNYLSLLLGAYEEAFKDSTGIYRSSGQLLLNRFAKANSNIAVIAPTSYGKSEIMLEKINENPNKRICVLVPTKALVSQTKRKLIKNGLSQHTRIITHPDMYVAARDEDSPFVAVFTQERLLRLFTKNPDVSLDMLFVDEAHNILGDDTRSLAIAQAVIIARKRNANIDISFFSPFVSDEANIAVLGSTAPVSESIDEHMKIEKYYFTKLESNALYRYDQFIDKSIFIRIDSASNAVEFVLNNATDKNVTYLNRPRDVEIFANQLARHTPALEEGSDQMLKAIASIREYTHPQYGLISCIEKGIVYHHGGMPEIIKMYVENLYADPGMSHLITTSTLMEGVNIPANKLFILNTGMGNGVLNKSQFINLVGRVGRFSEVFSATHGSLDLLEPSIYIVDDYNFARGNLNAESFYRDRVKLGTQTKDLVENPLLKEADDTEARTDEISFLANIEPDLEVSDLIQEVTYAHTEVGKLCFAHNIRDFDIIQYEDLIQARLDSLVSNDNFTQIGSSESLIRVIINVFLKGTVYEKNDTVKKLAEYESFPRYYAMFMDWFLQYAGYGYMINRLLRYWSDKHTVYVGRMGEVDRNGDPNAIFKKYVILDGKTLGQRVDLAISVTKENQDYIDNYIVPYLDILNDLGLIEESFYNLAKYHTDNPRVVALIKYGLTFELSSLLISASYSHLINITDIDFAYDKRAILERMRASNENEILIFEATNFL